MERLTNKREADQQRKNYEKRLEQGYPRNIPEERFLKLAYYEDMEEQGRLVVLPCRVGGTVWMIVTKRPKVNMPEYSFIKRSRLTWFNMERVLRCFGKTVFLTREKAEQALKGGADNGDRSN